MTKPLVQPGETRRHFVHVPMPMRDGTKLSANITLPGGAGPFPAVLMRTPYDNSRADYLRFALYFAEHGYAFIVQDVRGRGDSEGEWIPFSNEAQDGHDTVEWIAAQPWCTGKVGMMGGSYAAHVQWMAAKELPIHLAAMSSTAATGRWIEDGLPFRFGIPSLEMLYWLFLTTGRTLQVSIAAYEGVEQANQGINWPEVLYHLPLRTLPQAAGFHSETWETWLAHPSLDDYWMQMRLDGRFRLLNVPTLHISGWFDDCLIGSVFNYEKMVAESQAADHQYLLLGPWDHHGTREPQEKLYGEDFGPQALVDMLDLQRRFFDVYLKGAGAFDEPKVKYFVLGEGENRWRSAAAWPPPHTMNAFYLDSAGDARTLNGSGTLSPEMPGGADCDYYVYDPAHPTPAWPDHEKRWAPQDLTLDQRYFQKRDDVLVYTSPPLENALEIAGTPSIELYISSDAPDTDFFVTLCDVYPDGRALRLAWNALRTRYRESARRPRLMTPGEVVRLTLDLFPVCNIFKPGHRIRVDIRSASFPLSARNLNTGTSIGETSEMRPARQTVYHSTEYPSRILLPLTAH